jgi:hypothetical protein
MLVLYDAPHVKPKIDLLDISPHKKNLILLKEHRNILIDVKPLNIFKKKNSLYKYKSEVDIINHHKQKESIKIYLN